jgi:hypothetical protein
VQAHLTGNSVHVDKMFLRKFMPTLDAFLHFRIIDVSTVNELSRRWVPGKLSFLQPKKKRHTAMSDILESLEELRCYQKHMFSVPVKGQPIFVAYVPGCTLEESDAHPPAGAVPSALTVDNSGGEGAGEEKEIVSTASPSSKHCTA